MTKQLETVRITYWIHKLRQYSCYPATAMYLSIYLSNYLLPLFATPPAKGLARHAGKRTGTTETVCAAHEVPRSCLLDPRIASDQHSWRVGHANMSIPILLIPSPDWMCPAIPHLCWVCIVFWSKLYISVICDAFDAIPLKISVVFYKMPYHNILLKPLVYIFIN